MSGWIKLEKCRRDDPRVLRMARELRNAGVTHERFTTNACVTLVLGGLDQLWIYADTHIRQDDTLDIGTDEIDELVGVKGFASLIPSDWLEILDSNRIKLPGFHDHNGTESKRKALGQKRSERYRNAEALEAVTQESRPRNGHASLDQTKTKTIQRDANASRGSRRVPPDFTPDLAYARTQLPDIDAEREAQKFRDWEFKTPRKDWPAAWRTWIGNCRDRGGYAKVNGSGLPEGKWM